MKVLIKAEDLEKECEAVLEYDDKAITIIAQLEHVLRSNFKQNETVSGDVDRNITTSPEENGFSGVKLKSFELKKFDGNIENWLPFWELFKRAVHENRQLSVTAKFNFLSESLIGSAAATISGFTPTEKCYKEAIELLLEEYGHTDRIVEKFVQKLMSLNPVQSNNDIKGLRKVYNEVISTIRTLSAFQASSTQYDIMVKSILLKCIPATMRIQFHRKFCKTSNIKCDVCSGRHLTVLCEREKSVTPHYREQPRNEARQSENKSSTNWTSSSQNERTNSGATTTLNVSESGARVFLQTAKAIISNVNSDDHVFSRIIMDNGSQRTFVTEKLKNKLNLKPISVVNMNIVGFGNKTKNKVTEYEEVQISLKSKYQNKIKMIKAVVVPSICDNYLPCPEQIKYLVKNIRVELADSVTNEEETESGINLLIGQDNYWKFNTNNIEKLGDNFMAVKTFFGWTIQGHNKNENKYNENYVFNVTESEKEIENFDITKFWDLESIGIKPFAAYDSELYEKIIREIKFINGRYVVNLPWKNIDEHLNDNKAVAQKRLYYLTNKLLKSEEKLSEYDNEIKSLLKSDIVEYVNKSKNNQPIYYMPHKPVYREDKLTSKLRIVFDASSSENGCTSLNDHLSPVDNLVADLFTMLLRFRSNKIAIVADIEKDFLQIEISESDRDSHRFLWYKSKPALNQALPEIIELRMTRVTFGATSSPFLLTATINHHLDTHKKEFGSVCDKLKKSFYVDDLILSLNDEEEVKTIYYTAKTVMSLANFNLRKWTTNDKQVAEMIGESTDSVEQKVLGIIWAKTFDLLSVNLANNISYLQDLKPTKRNVLKAMAKIYDPMGFLGPFTVRIKILLQNIWQIKSEWDQLLTGEPADCFQNWQSELNILSEFNISRCLSSSSELKNELHIFADASPKAFGVVAYIRTISKLNEIKTNFVCSKNRISPMKQDNKEITLPKLELTAALIAARLQQFLISALDLQVHTTTLWTDSSITLNWINGQGKQCKPYVKTKVMEINNLTNINDWRHCDGKSNPADLLTRGIKAKELTTSKMWKFGPSWLLEDESCWPIKLVIEKSTNLFTHTIKTNKVELTESVIDIKRFSNINRLLRTTAYVFRFIERIKLNKANSNTNITASEIQRAEKYWIKTTQMQFNSEEILTLQKNLNKLPANSKITSLNPSLIDGVLKATCRLPEGEFCSDERNPIILPKNSYLSQLIVIETHKKTFHGGISTVLVHIRTKFWIVQARQLIKRVLQRCVVCLRLHGKSAMEPWTALPTERVTTSRPFETTGVDFAGPLYITSECNEEKKVYILLFTCAAIRAVHLELVGDMSTNSCIDAIRRFVARRGVPKKIISDNAKTFKRVNMELRKLEQLLKSNEIQEMAAQQNITWQFIPERAAWWGGFWERCVVVAIILAILCAYSLWKKRRTLCGWGFNEQHAQSEGDSAGSCYAPPQYSRCNSFHHPPPPYTEVTSKPDLYPLVFTCNSDNGKNGSSYLMVQYFRNYIVRPAGSLSAASTVDSLSSSFICNINEANTLVPPPYSRAASPEIGFSSHFQQQYMMPRSASQLVCQSVNNGNYVASVGGMTSGNGPFELNGNQQVYNGRANSAHYATVTVNATVSRMNNVATANDRMANFNANQRDFESVLSYDETPDSEERTNNNVNANVINCSSSSNDLRALPNSSGFIQSQSDQHFRFITNSNSSISDIFINNSCAAGIGGGGGLNRHQQSEESSIAGSISGAGAIIHPQAGGTPVIYSNGCIQPIPLHRASTNPTQFHVDSATNRESVLYQSNNSIGGISITVPTGIEDSSILCNDNEIRDLQLLRRSLETCCQLLQQQQKVPADGLVMGESPLRMNDLAKKYIDEGLLRSYVTSGTCSGVSSLVNIGTPSSPPQATSPTGEVKEILDQIRQLQEGVTKYEEDLVIRSVGRPILHHTLSSPSPTVNRNALQAVESGGRLQRISTMPEHQTLVDAAKSNILVKSIVTSSPTSSVTSMQSASSLLVESKKNKLTNSKSTLGSSTVTTSAGGGVGSGFIFSSSSKRPSTLQNSKKRFYTSKPPNKAMYIPMMATNQVPSGSRCTILKSPVSSVVNSNFFANRINRQRKGWISRSAPTTPATPMPPSYMGDDSPLLNEHDEDQEDEQCSQMDT